MRPITKLNYFSAVQAGQTANLVLDPGATYDQIYIKANNIFSDIEKITLKLNAEEIFSLTPAEIQAILFRKDQIMAMEYSLASKFGPDGDGGHFDIDNHRINTVLPLPLQLLDSVYDGTQRLTGLVLGPGDNCVIDVKLRQSPNTPTLEAYAETRAFPGVRQVVRKFERYTVPIAAAGEVNFTSILRGSRVLRMYFKTTSPAGNSIEALQIKRDGVEIWDVKKSDNEFVNWFYDASNFIETEIGGFDYVLDCVREGFPLKDAMSTQSNAMNFKIACSGADNIEIIVERLEPMARSWQVAQQGAKPKGRQKVGR